MQWTVLIPVRVRGEAKTRLTHASADAVEHRRLVEAIRADTIESVRAAEQVARVVLVLDGQRVDDSPVYVGTLTYVQQLPGLNAALGEAAADATLRWPSDAVAALVGDLPALHPDELDAALIEAAAHPAAFVPDADGTGTTLLTAMPGTTLDPGFGDGSAARHASKAVPLEAAAGLRRDVDTKLDLGLAASLGLGPATAAVVAQRKSRRLPPVHLAQG